MPPIAGKAVEMMAEALRTKTQPPANTLVSTTSYPIIEELVSRENESGTTKDCKSSSVDRARL